MNERDRLRARIRAARDQFPAPGRARANQAICDALYDYLEGKGASCVASYRAFRSEVDLRHLHDRWRGQGGRVLLPRTLGDGEMEFAEFHSDEQLVTGAYGIPEPTGDAVDLAAIDAVLVPGLAFDSSGGRLGYGAGYYDRFLAQIAAARPTRAEFVGVAFDLQRVDRLPVEPHDVHMDLIATENGIVTTS